LTVKAAEAKLKQINFDLTSQARYFSSNEIKTLTEHYSHVLGGGKRANVLSVDDEPRNNKQMVDFLDVVGVTVVFARSYGEAVLRLEERSFDVVVSDWSRPDDDVGKKAVAAKDQFWGSGAQLGRLLANSGCGRKVILFSSGSTEAMPIPPGVAAQTNNRYQLLLEIADGFRDEAQGCGLPPLKWSSVKYGI
jgi:CheY-like chemotaxis protein